MADNKKHHYVPKFYLKQFGNEEGKFTSLYNITRSIFVERAPISGQCYRDYMYGKDPSAEKLFSKLEGRVAGLMKDMIAGDIAPIKKSVDHHAIVTGVVLQQSRTEIARESVDQTATDLLRLLISQERPDLPLDGVKITMSGAAVHSVQQAFSVSTVLSDLDYVLLLNKSPLDFICSDNPVVLHNQLYEAEKKHSHIGYAAKGLQIFYPIGPRHLLLFFDKTSYTLGQKPISTYSVIEEKDIMMLNRLQWLNAMNNIYFLHSRHMEIYIRTLLSRTKGRQAVTSKFTVNSREHKHKDERHYIIHVNKPNLAIRLNLSFLRIRKGLRASVVNGIAPPVRNRNLVDVVTEFNRMRDSGRTTATNVRDYLADNLGLPRDS